MTTSSLDFDVTASIVIYETDPAELTLAVRSCLDTSLRVEVTVVDNSPNDDSAALCRSLGTKYVRSVKNVGFGAAHNIGINASSNSKYHLVLNPDVQFGRNVLEELFAFLELNEQVGLAMPRVQYPDGSSQNLCKRLPSPIDVLTKRFFSRVSHKMIRDHLAAFELRDLASGNILSVPYLSGCFMFLRKTALQRVGYFDERFFMYFEDLDLTRRIHQHYETVYYPGQFITHRHEMGSYKSTRLLLCGLQSAVRYFNKWGWIWDRERSAINKSIGPLRNVQIPAQSGVDVCPALRR